MRDVDFLRIKEIKNDQSIFWLGYWINRNSGVPLTDKLDEIKVNPADWLLIEMK